MDRPLNRRRRPPLACIECRRRKIKCDRNKPCANCITAKALCVYKLHHNGPSQRHENNSENSGDIGTSTSSAVTTNTPTSATTNATVATYDGTAASFGAVLNGLSQRVRELEEAFTSKSTSIEVVTGENLVLYSNTRDAQLHQNKTRVLRWEHWANTGSAFTNIINCFKAIMETKEGDIGRNDEYSTLLVEVNELLQKCKAIARALKAGRPSRSLSHSQLNFTEPSRDYADALAALYLENFESTYRILHIPSFWSDYVGFWQHPEVARNDVRLKVLLVIAIGSSLSEHHGPPRATITEWVYAAQSWLSGPLEKDRLEISGIQIHCLTILARQIFSIGGDLIWASMGSLVHCAMQIGLHRRSSRIPATSVFQDELRKRLWATVLELLVQSSLDSAMPPRISLDDYDIEHPSNIDDEDIYQSTTDFVNLTRDRLTGTSMQLLLLDSLPVRLRIVQLLNGLRTEISYTDVLALSSELTDACHKISNFTAENRTKVSSFQSDLLDYLVRRFLVPLHCPFASRAQENPMFSYSMQVSVDTALMLTSPDLDNKVSRLMMMGGGMFKAGYRAACTVLGLRLLVLTQSQRRDGTLRRMTATRDHLKRSVEHLISLATSRMRQGETNVKSHMFLSMLMAEVEALEQDLPSSLLSHMLLRAKKSLEFCDGLLRQQLDGSSPLGLGDGLTFDAYAEQDLDFGFDFFSLDARFI